MADDYKMVFSNGSFKIQRVDIKKSYNERTRYLGARLSNSSKNSIHGLALLALEYEIEQISINKLNWRTRITSYALIIDHTEQKLNCLPQ